VEEPIYIYLSIYQADGQIIGVSMADEGRNNINNPASFVITKGAVIDHYKIIDKIGAGGMGEVYLAEDTELKRKVALKFLPDNLCKDEDCRARFKREAQAAAKLNHPNIVTIHEVSEYKFRPFIVMEHILGESLRFMLKDLDVTMDKAVKITLDLCEGLNKAHSEGITHRDVKPSNIIIDSEGRAKLLDFGLATIQGDEKITKTGSTMGTVGYISPEQVRGETVDHRSDLFSVGVILYEMITGRQPFKEDYEAATMNAILNDIPEPLVRYKSDLPDEMQRIVSKLLEKDVNLRYQNASDVLADLKRLNQIAIKDTPPPKPVDWWNRYIVTGAVAILLILAGYWIATEYILKSSAEPQTERKMLAVLPFKNLGDPDDEYFADGITEEIMSRLSSISGLGIISSTSSFAYKDTKKTLPQIAEELKVEYILEGNIRWDKGGGIDRVRITPQLIDMEGDIHIWSENYDQQITDIFSIQTMIANSIAEALDIQLQDSEKEEIQTKPTDNIDAYHYYLKAKEFLSNAYEPAEAVIPIGMLNKAIQLDSLFIAAHVALVELYGGFGYMSSRWYFEKFDSLKQKAKFHANMVSKLGKNTADEFIVRVIIIIMCCMILNQRNILIFKP
jgi:serine/threonine protein kinase